jgi:hypothetical protein
MTDSDAMPGIDLDNLPADERQRIQRRKALRTALMLGTAAVLVFAFYVYQVARMAG